MSSVLDKSCVNSRQSAVRALCLNNRAVKNLKLSVGIILILAVLCILPAGAESPALDGLPDTVRNYLTTGCGNTQESEAVLENNANAKSLTVSSIRETKTRTAQKKNLIPAPKYQSYADEKGEVLFAESPIVTGMHLPKGVKGSVSLMNEPESAGPKCREVYNVFNIFVENYPQGLESTIRYTLSLSEIENRGYSPADISLYFRDAESWMKLPTEYYMDGQYAFFESVTTSAGLFAIVSNDCEREIEPVTLRLKNPGEVGITLDVTPVSILTHPMSYTTLAG
ncbi:MAG TPA: PGF-pre-PGF domain-containing protein [Methanocorpusculum sp.]|nr:PGF-pre-PGF domain-containing protein [Methanocorpusculum sp.]